MANEVSGVGKGFFTETGELKSKAQISKEEAKAAQSKSAPAPSESAETSISTAVGSVRSRFSEKANQIVSVINRDEQNLKEAGQAVKKQLDAAKELKAALKEGTKKEIAVAERKLEKATEARNALAEKVEKDNSALVTERSKNLSLGNEQYGIVSVKAVRLEKTEQREYSKPAEVNKLIDELKGDRADIAVQRKEHAEVKETVKEAISDTDVRLSKLEENSIRSIQEADSTARDLASRILSNGSQALSASKINESIVQQLLQ